MYYYGARYYDPRISIFVSVDPLAERTMTPYHYVHNNPINLIDPTGMSADPPEGEFAQGYKHTDEEGTTWKLNGDVWENLSGGGDEWKERTLNEVVIDVDNRSIGKKIVDGISNELSNAVQAIENDNNRMLSPVSSGPYSPLSGTGSGLSLSANIFGNTFGVSMAGEHYKGWQGTHFYLSYSAGHDAGFWKGIKQNTSLGKFISISGTFDTYHNKGFGGSFDKGVQGYTNDVFGGYGIMGSYSRPFDPSLNRVNPESGLYKTSIGISSPSTSIGLSRTKTIKLF